MLVIGLKRRVREPENIFIASKMMKSLVCKAIKRFRHSVTGILKLREKSRPVCYNELFWEIYFDKMSKRVNEAKNENTFHLNLLNKISEFMFPKTVHN